VLEPVPVAKKKSARAITDHSKNSPESPTAPLPVADGTNTPDQPLAGQDTRPVSIGRAIEKSNGSGKEVTKMYKAGEIVAICSGCGRNILCGEPILPFGSKYWGKECYKKVMAEVHKRRSAHGK